MGASRRGRRVGIRRVVAMTDPTYAQRETLAEADAEDARDAVDDDQADWLAERDQPRR